MTEISRSVRLMCDVCKTDHRDEFETQEFVRVKYRAGYGAVLGDGNIVEIDICQHCFKKAFGDNITLRDPDTHKTCTPSEFDAEQKRLIAEHEKNHP